MRSKKLDTSEVSFGFSFVMTNTLPEAAAGVSHESHEYALDELCSHGGDNRRDADFFARLNLARLKTLKVPQSRLERLEAPELFGMQLL